MSGSSGPGESGLRRFLLPGLLALLLVEGTQLGQVERRTVLRRAWPVMGTLFEATAVAPDSAAARKALSAGRRAVFRVDSLMSTYRPRSEISRLNRRAGTGRWTRLSALTADVLREALSWASRSGGALDPTVGPLVAAWGFRSDSPGRPSASVRDSARRLVGHRRVEVRDAGRLARLPDPGMRLDLGAVAKGAALDRAEAAMRRAGAGAGMLDLGGQVLVWGRPPAGEEPAWTLGIRHPRAADRLLGTLRLRDASAATSGDTEQFFEAAGRRYSHVMDPRAGRPARGVAQVTVVAESGTAADALATILFVMGPEEGGAWLRRSGLWADSGGSLSAALWVRDPGDGPVCPGHLRSTGPGADQLELSASPRCAGTGPAPSAAGTPPEVRGKE